MACSSVLVRVGILLTLVCLFLLVTLPGTNAREYGPLVTSGAVGVNVVVVFVLV